MIFIDKYRGAVRKNGSYLCVGLDPDPRKIPEAVEKEEQLFTFCKEIVDVTADLVCAFKPNSAFFEALGAEGIRQLHTLTWYIKTRYPDIPIILDAKRGDIGNTNAGYVAFAFDYLGVDAVTLQPYLGKEALAPFLARKENGCIILCKTSNEGAGEFQDLPAMDEALFLKVARHVAKDWNENGNCALVVGAAYPQDLAKVREIAGHMPILIPGIGVQGGDLEKTVKAGRDHGECANIIVNVSRSILYAAEGHDWKQAAREEAERIKDGTNKALIG